MTYVPWFQCNDNMQRQITRSYTIYPLVPFPILALSDPWLIQGHGVTIDALDVLCAQLTRDLFAIAKFLFLYFPSSRPTSHLRCGQVQVSGARFLWEQGYDSWSTKLESLVYPLAKAASSYQHCLHMMPACDERTDGAAYALRGVYSDTTQLNSTELNWTQLRSKARSWRHKQKQDWPVSRWLAVRCSTGSVQLSSVELRCVVSL